MEQFYLDILKYWTFIAFAGVLSILAQTGKSFFPEKGLLYNNIKKSFPLILLSLGAFCGFIWRGDPAPGIESTYEKVLYFMGAACVSMVGFDIAQAWIKNRFHIKELK